VGVGAAGGDSVPAIRRRVPSSAVLIGNSVSQPPPKSLQIGQSRCGEATKQIPKSSPTALTALLGRSNPTKNQLCRLLACTKSSPNMIFVEPFLALHRQFSSLIIIVGYCCACFGRSNPSNFGTFLEIILAKSRKFTNT